MRAARILHTDAVESCYMSRFLVLLQLFQRQYASQLLSTSQLFARAQSFHQVKALKYCQAERGARNIVVVEVRLTGMMHACYNTLRPCPAIGVAAASTADIHISIYICVYIHMQICLYIYTIYMYMYIYTHRYTHIIYIMTKPRWSMCFARTKDHSPLKLTGVFFASVEFPGPAQEALDNGAVVFQSYI